MRKLAAVCAVGLLFAACSDSSSSGAGGPRPPDRGRATEDSAQEGYGEARTTGRIQDARIAESSGLVASAARPGTFWTHNDSGGRPTIYCIRPDGRSCGAVAVSGAGTFDWEDIARGPGPEPGVQYLYIGDIGDNTASRSSIVVYRVAEPPGGTSGEAVDIVLTFPDGPHDAETLLVHPETGDLYVISKGESPVVYVARAPLARSMSMEVAGKAPASGLLPGPTGGDISSDGRRVILSTYTGALELVARPGAGFDSIWKRAPLRISLPAVVQREAIAYSLDGRSIVSTSEGLGAPIQWVTRR